MRLQPRELESYCHSLARKTENRFTLKPSKSQYWYWKLDIVNNDTWEEIWLASSLTLREAHEFVRAFYRWLEYSKLLNPKEE